jgi:hypothetical protein
MTTAVGVGMGADTGFGILQAANNNKIRLALAAEKTFFIFMGDFLFVCSWFGFDINSPLPDKRKETISQKTMACLLIIYKTLPSHIHRLGSVFLAHLGEGYPQYVPY